MSKGGTPDDAKGIAEQTCQWLGDGHKDIDIATHMAPKLHVGVGQVLAVVGASVWHFCPQYSGLK